MQLQKIPGVGKTIEKDLNNLGIFKVEDLKNKNPNKLYKDLCDFQGVNVDRCMLYVISCAIYFATEPEHDPELLKWWNWKNKSSLNN